MHVNYNNPTLKFIAVHPSFFERKKKEKKKATTKNREKIKTTSSDCGQ